MLSTESLKTRLADWTSALPRILTQLPDRQGVPPIALYQHFYRLTHDLRSSIGLSDDTAVQGLRDTVEASDAILRKLAFDLHELAPEHNEGLLMLGLKLESLESLQVFLENAFPKAKDLSKADAGPIAALFAQSYPWDTLARARATSCARHGYGFFARSDLAELTSLPTHEEQAQREFALHGALLVTRKLDPRPGSAGSTTLQLALHTLAAFPPGFTAQASSGQTPRWQPVALKA